MATRLREVLEGRRDEIEGAIQDAEGELLTLRGQQLELERLIARARVAIGVDALDVTRRGRAPSETLHIAMARVLGEHTEGLPGRELADEVNRRGLYRQRNGTPVGVNQIHARASNYRDLFAKKSGRIVLRPPKAEQRTRGEQ